MGLFGFLGKALGKVVKVGLSTVTHGVSDKVLNVAGSVLHKTKPAIPLTMQNQAALLKIRPMLKSTEGVLAGTPGMKPASRSRRRKTARRKRARSPAVTSKPVRATRSRAKAKKKRTLPPALNAQAQKTKALAATWRAAGGRAGTGQTFFQWKVGR